MNDDQVRSVEQESSITTASIYKRNRFFGIIIILMIVAPMLLAYIMFKTGWGVSASQTNKGELLTPPLPIQDLRLANNEEFFSELFAHKKAKKKWRLLIPVTSACAEDCEKNLYTTRQVHIRLAEKAYRVERVLLFLGTLSPSLQSQLSLEHPNTLQLDVDEESFMQWISVAENSHQALQHYYLIDQQGYVMMRYNTSNTGQDLLDDIKKLLKFTYDN
jgi:cytochrome oxidase Cu insertion factor (SCO1/SenC/PrrC family)